MTTVEPIRNKSDIKKVEKVLAKQSQRDLMLFVLGTNCGLRISDLLFNAFCPRYKLRFENF